MPATAKLYLIHIFCKRKGFGTADYFVSIYISFGIDEQNMKRIQLQQHHLLVCYCYLFGGKIALFNYIDS